MPSPALPPIRTENSDISTLFPGDIFPPYADRNFFKRNLFTRISNGFLNHAQKPETTRDLHVRAGNGFYVVLLYNLAYLLPVELYIVQFGAADKKNFSFQKVFVKV